MTHFQYTNLIFEGGGVKGFAHVGALLALEEKGMLKSVRNYAGTSIGGIIAGCLAMGITPNMLYEEVMSKDISELQESEWLWRKIHNLMNYGGCYRMQRLREWLIVLIRKAGHPESITLKELFDVTHSELVIATCKLNRRCPVYFHHATAPDITLLDAMCMSASFPGYYTLQEYKGNKYCDGGVTDNYPYWVFNDMDRLYEGRWSDIPTQFMDTGTLGLKILAPHQIDTPVVYTGNDKINSVLDTLSSIFNTLFTQIERQEISQTYMDNTISIHCGNVSALDFDITKMGKEFLMDRGRTAVRDFFKIH